MEEKPVKPEGKVLFAGTLTGVEAVRAIMAHARKTTDIPHGHVTLVYSGTGTDSVFTIMVTEAQS